MACLLRVQVYADEQDTLSVGLFMQFASCSSFASLLAFDNAEWLWHEHAKAGPPCVRRYKASDTADAQGLSQATSCLNWGRTEDLHQVDNLQERLSKDVLS